MKQIFVRLTILIILSTHSSSGCAAVIFLFSDASCAGVVGLLRRPGFAARETRRLASARGRRHSVTPQRQRVCQQSAAHQSPLL